MTMIDRFMYLDSIITDRFYCTLFDSLSNLIFSFFFFLCIFQEYIHRVGRTARGENQIGYALLMLRPEELGFLRYLKHARVPLQEYDFSWHKIANVQNQASFCFKLVIYLSKICFCV